jgi:hypothetical protein
MDRASSFPVCRHWLGSPLDSLCYAVQRKAEKAKAAREHFERLGFTVIDLTVNQPWEHVDVVEPIARAAPKPRKKGIVQLDAGLVKDTNTKLGTVRIVGFHTEKLIADEAPRITDPEFVVKISSQANTSNKFPDNYGMDSLQSLAVVRKYGHLAGVVQNSSQEDKLISQGAKPMKPWLANKLLEEYKTNPLIQQHYENSVSHRSAEPELVLDWDQGRIFKMIRRDTELRKTFGLPDPLPTDERDVIAIFESFSKYDRNATGMEALKEIDTLIAGWKIAPAAKSLVEKVKGSKLLDIIEESQLDTVITGSSSRYTPKHQKTARSILLLALES